jgi:hypothetical protein
MPARVTSRWPKNPPPDDGPKTKAPDGALKRGAKKVASKALDATGPSITTATTVTGTGTIALATGAAAASATGVGLVVVGTLATLGSAAKSIVAARSSKQHRDGLMFISALQRWREYPCAVPPEADGETDLMAHQRIAFNVLPYAIEQKDKKYHRKAIGAVPVLGTIPMAIRQAYRALTKENRGELREQMAYELAVHLVTHNCGLAQVIVAELFSSYEKMLWMLDQDTDVLTPVIMEKLKSV